MITPSNLASCSVCGCLVLVHRDLTDWAGDPLTWDPCASERRVVRSLLTRADVARQGFGLIEGGWHECPPESECRLKDQDRMPARIAQDAPGRIPGPWGVLRAGFDSWPLVGPPGRRDRQGGPGPSQ